MCVRDQYNSQPMDGSSLPLAGLALVVHWQYMEVCTYNGAPLTAIHSAIT